MARTTRVRRLNIVSSGRATSVSIDSSAVEDGQYDASGSEKIAGVATAEDRRNWPHPGAASFIRSSAGLEGQWIGIRPLGAGSFGVTGLWEKRDDDGKVVDYMVIKQIKGSNRRWDSELPDEVRIMKQMNKTHCRGVVRLRGYKRYNHKKVHRLYLRYCPYGDLRRLIDRYRRFRRYFPEAFLWEVFHCLMEAADAMANGPVDKDWGFQIVHRDIKPDNIFLGYPYEDSNGIPHYPTAKLGDFGVARECYLTDLGNPSELLEAGTKGWQAPEQLRSFYDVRQAYLKGPFIIYGHTNTWAIGAVMYELLTLRRVDKIWLRGVADLHHGINPIITDQRPEYSRALKEAIRDCLRPYPRERPSVYSLLETIDEHRSVIREHLSEHSGDRPIGPIPIGGNRLYYRGSEINEMRPGNWQPYTDDEEMDPGDPDGGWHDPGVSPIIFPRFPDAALPENEPQTDKNTNRGRRDIVREIEEDATRRAESKAVWNVWHAREDNGQDLRAEIIEVEHVPERGSSDFSGDGEWDSDDVYSASEGSEREDVEVETRGSYLGEGDWPTDAEAISSSRTNSQRKASRNGQGGLEQEDDEEGEEEEEDESPIQNYRQRRARNRLRHPEANTPSSSKGKRKTRQNNQEGTDQEDKDQNLTRNPKRRRGLKKRPTAPEPPPSSKESEESSEDEASGIGPEAGGQAEQEDTEGEVDDQDRGTSDHSADDDEYAPVPLKKTKAKPQRRANWESQSYQPPGKRRTPRKKR